MLEEVISRSLLYRYMSGACNNMLIFLSKQLKILVRANLDLIKWARGNQMPGFEEYVEVGGVVLTSYATLMYSFVGMGETVGKEAYKWVRSKPKLIKSLAAKSRLLDDMTDFEVKTIKYLFSYRDIHFCSSFSVRFLIFNPWGCCDLSSNSCVWYCQNDMSNGFSANAINYYMKQFLVTKEEPILECQKMIVDINKTVNEELLKTIVVPHRVLKQAHNFGRLLHVLYSHSDDIYNCSEGKLKEYI